MDTVRFPTVSDPPQVLPEPSFWHDLQRGAREGAVLCVKYALATAGILLAVYLLLTDYGTVRQQAQRGQAAFEFIQRQLEAQTAQKPPSAPLSPEKPIP